MRELKIIKSISRRAGNPGKGVKTGIGDDCAVLEYSKDQYLLWASDMLTEGTHFTIKDGYKRIGRKAIAVNISDIAAMGGTPKYVLISLGVTKKTKSKDITAIYDGIFAICKKYGVKVIGGDTVRSKNLVIDVSIVGSVKKKDLVLRAGAKEKDLVIITGPVRNGKKEHLDFIPRVEESKYLRENFKINSMIDTSDGIAMDISRICSESLVGCRLYEEHVPLAKGLSLKDALYYGESFELLFTMSFSEAKKLYKELGKIFFTKYFVIGEITKKKDGLVLVGKAGKEKKLVPMGYKHL